MTTRVGSYELRNDTAGVLRKAEAGEDVIITVHGRDVARLTAVDDRPRSISTARLFRDFSQADSGLDAELREMVPDTTDDLSWP